MSASETSSLPECLPSDLALVIIHTAISLTLSTLILYFIYKFITNLPNEKLTKSGKILGFLFLTFSCIAIPLQNVFKAQKCYNIPTAVISVTLPIYLSSFSLQLYLLLIIFFERLSTVFATTKFRLSLFTTRFYTMFWILFPCIIIIVFSITVMIPSIGTSPWWSLGTTLSGMTMLLGIMISLIILYVFKLIQVYKSIEFGGNQFLVSAITKTTLLTSSSIGITLLDMVIVGMTFKSDSKVMEWMQTYLTMLDIFTNFLCVVLYYEPFKPIYGRLCSCCDSVCNRCWAKCVTRASSESANNLKMIQTSIAAHETARSITQTGTSSPGDMSTTTKSVQTATSHTDANQSLNENKNVQSSSSTPVSEQSDNYTVNNQLIRQESVVIDTENI